ncbi:MULTISPECIES: NAD-dependent epimerase/dehydratase family protein [Mumia]|uniref:NAD-dependent epimerase/dehydratase family protein n=1 Tax=Mumia TaxID=1546255 RepID=UPI00141D7F6E|nr:MULTISPECIES: NAD-dependent epimerase/dehydratase family protein [unclassified Mumia]QMW66900.1 NAD-dependent epimerase/dehydratase family protein [Mumia sp. ZJ1417]
MRLLVLGGTHHVGRAAVEEALARGHEVTTLTRGTSGPPADGVDARYADRRDPAAVAAALGDDSWDAVFDTWSQEPSTVRTGARLLADRVAHYGYVSSRSVYAWPPAPGADESAPVVDGDPDIDDASDYGAAKRGAELAVLDAFGERALVARAGLVIGPYEQVGRLPWWLERVARGGEVLAPGPADRPLQYVDGRDLAAWMLDCAEAKTGGVVDAVSPPGHTTTQALLHACVAATRADASLVWAPPEVLAAEGITGWSDLPIWVPPTGDLAGLHESDTRAAYEAGLRCRPIEETVADTWAWLQAEGRPTSAHPERQPSGIDAETERLILARVRGSVG